MPKIGIRLEEGKEFKAPCDGWFLSDTEIKDLLMDAWDGFHEYMSDVPGSRI